MNLFKSPYITWDTYKIIEAQAHWLIEDGHFINFDDALVSAQNDYDLINCRWDWLTEDLTNLITEVNPNGCWKAEGHNMGWRHLSGTKEFKATNGIEFLKELLPKADVSFEIYLNRKTIRMKVYHHDAPTGELYTIRRIV